MEQTSQIVALMSDDQLFKLLVDSEWTESTEELPACGKPRLLAAVKLRLKRPRRTH